MDVPSNRWMDNPGEVLNFEKDSGQVGMPVVMGIVVLVAIAFGSLGYALAPKAITKDKVMDYVKKAPEEDLKEILALVPDSVLKEEARGRFPVTVVDDLGRGVIVSERPQRLVSVAPSITETLFALGLESRIIGVTEHCDYPPKVTELVENGGLETVGGFATLSVEKIVSLQPDLVLGTTGVQEESVRRLDELGVTVIALEGDNIPDVVKDIELVGRVTGASARAEELAENMRSEMERIAEETETMPENRKPKVFYELGVEPIFTAGPGTFIHELIELGGGINIAENAGKYSVFSVEKIVELNPDVYIIGVHGTELPLSTVEEVRNRFPKISAAKNGRVFKLTSSEVDMFVRAGPRLIQALRKMVLYLHPELSSVS